MHAHTESCMIRTLTGPPLSTAHHGCTAWLVTKNAISTRLYREISIPFVRLFSPGKRVQSKVPLRPLPVPCTPVPLHVYTTPSQWSRVHTIPDDYVADDPALLEHFGLPRCRVHPQVFRGLVPERVVHVEHRGGAADRISCQGERPSSSLRAAPRLMTELPRLPQAGGI